MNKIIPQNCRIKQNKKLAKSGGYYSLVVEGFRAPFKIIPGHFVHVKVNNSLEPYFRRAFSVAHYQAAGGELEIIYKTIGRGTTILGTKKKGDYIDLIGPLGNHFTFPRKNQQVIIIAGGVGLPPLYYWARYLVENNFDPKSILFFYGGRTRFDLVELARIRKLEVRLIACTDNGEYGFHGMVTTAVMNHLAALDHTRLMLYGCGPEAMLGAMQNLALEYNLAGEMSLEAPMPCGVGVCLGCIKPRLDNPAKYVRVCYDGPIFKIGEVKI